MSAHLVYREDQHAISKAFDISRNTPLALYPSPNELQISCVIDNSLLMHKSLVLKSTLFGEIIAFSMEISNRVN